MQNEKPEIVVEKIKLHPKNPNRFGYNFEQLIKISPELKDFFSVNEYHTQVFDFSNPKAIKLLNKSLLIAHYDIEFWEIPENYLCPPIPGRADYIYNIGDLLASSNNGIIPVGETVQGLDIGIGANCVYPIIGNAVYEWSFVGTDSDEKAIQNCKKIIEGNSKLIDAISLQLQINSHHIFKNIILPEDRFAFTMCNPPFHSSKEEATISNIRKISNLQNTRIDKPALNFGGQNAELWCEGGEIGFITQMIYESAKYPLQVLWFTTLVSKKDNLKSIYKTLNKVDVVAIKTFDMAQGQKKSRIVAWTFLSEAQQKAWKFE